MLFWIILSSSALGINRRVIATSFITLNTSSHQLGPDISISELTTITDQQNNQHIYVSTSSNTKLEAPRDVALNLVGHFGKQIKILHSQKMMGSFCIVIWKRHMIMASAKVGPLSFSLNVLIVNHLLYDWLWNGAPPQRPYYHSMH